MELIKSFLLLIVLAVSLQAQVSLPLRLVTSTGTPLTGQSANISFTRYPHSYPTNVVSGITVAEIGTAGNYKCTGFSTWEYVKLWVSGVEQTWFDSVQVGNIKDSYLIPNYPRLSISNTFTGSTNTFVSGYFSGSVVVENQFEAVEPYINSLGDPYLLYQHSQNSLVHVRLADSLYGRKFSYSDGDKERLFTGKKLYGRTNTVSPFEINTDQFNWAQDKLNLSPSFFSNDSIKAKIFTSGKDSTWLVLGEPVSKWRFLSLKKGFWANSLNIPDWKWIYESYNESGVLQARDSFAVINNIYSTDNNNAITLGTSATKLDSLLLPPGVYSVGYGINYRFVDISFGEAPTIQPDSLGMALVIGTSSPADYIYATQQYFVDVNYGRMGSLSWTSQVTITATGYIYLLGIRQNTETGSGHTTRRSYITATLIK